MPLNSCLITLNMDHFLQNESVEKNEHCIPMLVLLEMPLKLWSALSYLYKNSYS